MQKVKLPKQVDPVKSASKRSDYQGVYEAKDMVRLGEAVDQVLQDIAISLKFDTDAQGLTFFEGRLQTSVTLQCQRCNEHYVHDIDTEFCFCPITEQDDVDELPDAYEPVELNEHGEINLLELFEDELILTLPIVAMHPEGQCARGDEDMSFGEIEPADVQESPFAVLKELKRNQE